MLLRINSLILMAYSGDTSHWLIKWFKEALRFMFALDRTNVNMVEWKR